MWGVGPVTSARLAEIGAFTVGLATSQPKSLARLLGRADGLGLMAARLLINHGHQVVLHGRNERRSRDAQAAAPGALGAVIGENLDPHPQRSIKSGERFRSRRLRPVLQAAWWWLK